MIHTCTSKYEYVKLFTKALFATALMGGGFNIYRYWSNRFYRKTHNSNPGHFLESKLKIFIHIMISALYFSPHTQSNTHIHVSQFSHTILYFSETFHTPHQSLSQRACETRKFISDVVCKCKLPINIFLMAV